MGAHAGTAAVLLISMSMVSRAAASSPLRPARQGQASWPTEGPERRQCRSPLACLLTSLPPRLFGHPPWWASCALWRMTTLLGPCRPDLGAMSTVEDISSRRAARKTGARKRDGLEGPTNPGLATGGVALSGPSKYGAAGPRSRPARPGSVSARCIGYIARDTRSRECEGLFSAGAQQQPASSCVPGHSNTTSALMAFPRRGTCSARAD